jgi:hypothetical protein
MKPMIVWCLFFVTVLAGCASKALPPVAVTLPTHAIDYQKEVKPLLDKRCTVCHSCYNSPCQLKMDSYEGVNRGATKRAIYNASRLTTMEPTRLFIDARTTEEWRRKKFSSVTENTAPDGFNNSLMIQMLSHKMKSSSNSGEYYPEADDLTCAQDREELGGYLEKHPNRGMPFGFPPLKQDEFDTIAGWLVQGAHGPDSTRQQLLETPLPADVAAIEQWENFLNQEDAKHAVTARYLYEHLFLAHLRFGSNNFYELVRSRTAPGTPLDLIATVRPYDDPGVPRVYYRFRKIHSTIVHKTHMVFNLDTAAFARIQELFIVPEWLQPPHQIDYDPIQSANPFVAFEQIPPRSRYQFLLDNVEYIVMTYIHGPVCKGQIALNVINDHFWVMFMDPDHDLSVIYPGFLKMNFDSLVMPIEKGSDFGVFSAITDRYSKAAKEFYKSRQNFYRGVNNDGLGYDAIWKGLKAGDAPLLTIYRHFDSASVHRGALGNLPQSLWVIDFPLLERIYYSLVAGFDVYGTAGHQLSLRLFMDSLRIEGESNFLDFMPPEQRIEIMKSWYTGFDLKKTGYVPPELPARVSFVTTDPKREFVEHIVDNHLRPDIGITFDPINYLREGSAYPELPERYQAGTDYVRILRALSQPGMPFVKLVTDHNANLAYLRIRSSTGKDAVISMVVNRWHDNVAFFLGEDDRLDPTRDDVDFIPGMVGSYPNYFFDVAEFDLPDFIDLLAHFSGGAGDIARLEKYGINRSDERFWPTYDWFQKRFHEDEPIRGGLFDLNRYFYKAR